MLTWVIRPVRGLCSIWLRRPPGCSMDAGDEAAAPVPFQARDVAVLRGFQGAVYFYQHALAADHGVAVVRRAVDWRGLLRVGNG
ncbi:hypothetical protein, partial [Verminephrobacter aporrectodeae]|uniref:hypothetical protein n=1 Tax=Verminephrobacter aporrectodeae TaxID=1110389 RepID=UPI001F41EE93